MGRVSEQSLYRELGMWLQKLRNDSRMGYDEVARIMGVHSQDVEAWENGAPLALSQMMTLLRIYHVDAELVGAKLGSLYINHAVRLTQGVSS